jgi:hypothetical protein
MESLMFVNTYTSTIDGKTYNIKDIIRVLFDRNFLCFIPFGFSVVNIGILMGLDFHEMTKASMIFYFICIIAIMFHTYYLSFKLFHLKCLLSIKDWLHYTICFELAIGFIFGLIYSYYPIISPYLMVPIIYGIISLLQYRYWKSYTKIYSKYMIAAFQTTKNNLI